MSGNIDIDNSIDYLEAVEAQKQADVEALGAAADNFINNTSKVKDPFLAFIYFMQLMTAYNGDDTGTILGVQEDKIREIGVQKIVTNAFSSVVSDAQSVFTNGLQGTAADADPIGDLRNDLNTLQTALDGLKDKPGTPFDAASVGNMTTAIDNLLDKLDQVESGYKLPTANPLENLNIAAKTPANDELSQNGTASSLIKSFNDQFSAMSTTTQTVSNAISTTMELNNADYQQYLGVLNNLLQALHKQNDAPVKASRG